MLKKIKNVWFVCVIYRYFALLKVQILIEMLSRKAEGIDPVKPWQPFILL